MSTKRRLMRKELSLTIMNHDLTQRRTLKKDYVAHIHRVYATGTPQTEALCGDERSIAWAYHFNFFQVGRLCVCEGCLDYLEEHGSQDIRKAIRALNQSPVSNTGVNS